MDLLHRLIQTHPAKAGPENRLQIDHPLPRPFECFKIEIGADGEVELLDINARLYGLESMKEHSLLQRREWVAVLYVARLVRHALLKWH